MDLENAIVRSITEICEEKGLNATNFVNDGESIRWDSTLGILGQTQYRVQFSKFKESLESGMRNVSILIAFAELITKEENKGMIDNIKEANNRGAQTYFYMSSFKKNTMKMSVPMADRSRGFSTIPIKYTQIEDGKYEWTIPESVELYSSMCNEEDLKNTTRGDLSRIISDYVGLERGASDGVPVLYATQSAGDYLFERALECQYGDEDTESKPEIDYEGPTQLIGIDE